MTYTGLLLMADKKETKKKDIYLRDIPEDIMTALRKEMADKTLSGVDISYPHLVFQVLRKGLGLKEPK